MKPHVYIDAPTYTPNSNGIRCLYFLAKELASQEFDVAFLPRNTRGFRKKLPNSFKDIKSLPPWKIKSSGILICSESVPAKTVKQARKNNTKIIWWYLAPHGLLEKPKILPKDHEEIAVFSPYVVLQNGDYCYFQPPIDRPWHRALSTYRPKSDHRTLSIALYCGKGRLRRLSTELQSILYNSEVRLITRSFPPTRKKLFKLLASVDGLITFDELSQLSLEAATLGIPVLLANPVFPEESLDSFPIQIKSLLTRDSAKYAELLSMRRLGNLKSLPQASIFSSNENSVRHLVELITHHEQHFQHRVRPTLKKMENFSRLLRRKRVLYPHYGGQAAGTFLIGLYIMSLYESPGFHRLACHFIAFVDQLGKLMFMFGAGSVFTAAANRLKGSRLAQKGPRIMARVISS